MNLDIQTTVRIVVIFLAIAFLAMSLTAFRAFREAGRLRFFLKKRELLGRAWQFVLFASLIAVFTFFIGRYAEPLTYRVFPPSPTITLTPTITVTPTITITPTITTTPTITPTPIISPTPLMPIVISENFISKVTPNPDARFSSIRFSTQMDDDYQPINPSDTFDNPVNTIYGSFSYENMITNSQWSALWFRDGELVYYESKPWNGASGGFGYTDSKLTTDQWQPGTYEVQLFVGETWKATGLFRITGTPPTPAATITTTNTITPSVTYTATITLTPAASYTETGALVPTATITPFRTFTLPPTRTNTAAPVASLTATPSLTATITPVPSITLIPTATRYSTFYR